MFEDAEKVDAETDGVNGVAEGEFVALFLRPFWKGDFQVGVYVFVCVDVEKSDDFRREVCELFRPRI